MCDECLHSPCVPRCPNYQPKKVGRFWYSAPKAKGRTGASNPLNWGRERNSVLPVAVSGENIRSRCISRRILQKKVFPDPLAPYRKDTLLNLDSSTPNVLSRCSFLLGSISVVNTTCSAKEAKFSADKDFKIAFAMSITPFTTHYIK